MTEHEIDRFERLATQFHEDTGFMAPGKDQPGALGSSDDYQRRLDAWCTWLRSRPIPNTES